MEESENVSSPARRLSQLFSEYATSTPGSPRPLPRRSRVYNPPPPPYSQSTAALGLAFDRLHQQQVPASQSFDRLQSSFPLATPATLNLSQSFDRLQTTFPPVQNTFLPTDRHPPDRPPSECHSLLDLGDDATDWQGRCGEMQLELQRFKCQAAKVRDLLQEKMLELEVRVARAEDRADVAEDKLRVMEERADDRHQVPVVEQRADAVPACVINKLETQVEEQRQLRLQDAKQVEAKAAKIKEWVTNKLRELEEQNQLLRVQNQKCNAQLELLKNHLASSQASLARPISTAASVGSLASSGEPVYAEVERRRSHRRHLSTTAVDFRDMPSIEPIVMPTTSLPRCEETTHDYAEIYTPSCEKVPWMVGEVEGEPPTPPLHRFPSWESRIYQVAADGLQLGPGCAENGHTSTAPTTGYCDISVPVYATVKGRASQIRSMPFTGDSSDDSSDGEDHNALQLDTQPTNSSTSSTSDKQLTNRSSDNISSGSISPSKSSLSPAKLLGSVSPFKRDTSLESGMSDYAVPPDALSCNTTASVGSSVLCRASTLTTEQTRTRTLEGPGSDLEKSGHLAKLGGKLKTWRKRYFVLRNGMLSFWKTQSDLHRKPQGVIVLDDACRISRADGAATFEINTGKKVFYLTADSIATMEDWVRVLVNVQRRNATKLLLSKEDNKPTISGWATKVKNGHGKKCWCVLIGKMFMYFKTPSDITPIGQINMRDTRAEEVEHVSDSDSEEREAEVTELTIGLFPSHQGPTYLILDNKQDKDQWLYQLTVVSGCGPSGHGTSFEQLVQKLMETDGDPSCVLWRHPQLLHSKDCILSPLTTLSSETLQAEAIKLFKSCQLFMSVQLDSAGIDYHVVLAQNALAQCLSQPELQAELMCSLIKQTRLASHSRATGHVQQLLLCATQSLFACETLTSANHPSSAQSGSPTSLQAAPVALANDSFALVQGWQLLALAVSLFVPRNNRLLWLLKLHINRNTDPKSECGKYAAYCSRALERTLVNGGRETKPSRMEVLSILLKNPYHHSLPHAIPVHMLNGAYQVVGFDGSTTIDEFLVTLNAELVCRDSANSGFTLFSDDPIEKDMEHYLDPNAKLCDVISKWETALREKGSGKFENSRVIQLTYKNRLYWRHSQKMETDRERLLLCYQVNQQVVQGRFPLSRELAQELAALMAQIDFGEYNSEKARGSGGANPGLQALQALDRFYPYRYKDGISQEELKELEVRLQERWALLKGRSVLDCVRIYLTCVRKWSLCGAALFQATRKSQAPAVVWLAVAEDGVTLLELASMTPIKRVTYSSVVTFGGCQDDFMLVVQEEGGGSRKMIFLLAKPKILEVTLLIADYMNALGHPLPPGTPLMGSLTRHRTLTRPGTAATQPDILKSTPDHQLTRSDSKRV